MITQSQLRSVIDYCPETGTFTWKVSRSRLAKAGMIAGRVTDRGYRHIEIGGKPYAAHRLVFLFMEGSFPAGEVDHANRNKDDNRLCNLRKVTRLENMKNRGQYRNNTSGHVGVVRRGNRWRAKITVGGKFVSLGMHDTFEDAVAAYREAKRTLHAIECLP